ncbi:hypothetical protein HYT84_00765 [Candidatus Micrarchaeota archaeon]|nr:hypothetical protein [Candidatus Micrarchaeota archaeon]
MSTVHAEIKKWGNSFAFIIPAEKVKELDLEEGQSIDAEINKCERIDSFGIFKGKKPFKRDKDKHEDIW